MGRMVTAHTALTGANTATGDLYEVIDISDTTDGPGGTNKKHTRAELWNAMLQASPSTTLVVTNLDAGASGTAGTIDVFPTTASKGKLQIAVTDQTGDTTVTMQIGAMAAARTITLPDPGAAASYVLSTGTSTATSATSTELNYLDIATLGTGAASKAVVLDAGDDYIWPATGVLTYGVLNDGTTALAATALEINRACDVSTRIVLAGATLAVTVALHDGKIISLDQLAGSVCTLPAAAGTGAVFTFITGVLATSNSHIIKVADASGLMAGVIVAGDNADGSATAFATVADSDTITLNRSTTGSVRIGGDRIVLTDIATNVYSVSGCTIGTGGEATPFSATV